MSDARICANVRILDVPYSIDKTYEYLVPEHLKDSLVRGSIAAVPFGRGDKLRLCVVTDIHENREESALKSVDDVCPDGFSVDEEMLRLCGFMTEQLLCTFGDALRTVFPAGVIMRLQDGFAVPDDAPGEPEIRDGAELEVFSWIRSHPGVTFQSLKARFGPEARRYVGRLLNKKYLTRTGQLTESLKPRFLYEYELAIPYETARRLSEGEACDGLKKIAGDKQREVLSALLRLEGQAPLEEIESECGFKARVQLQNLAEKNIIRELKKPLDRNPYRDRDQDPAAPDYVLNEEQAKAVSELTDLADSGEAKGALLYGVTGSGKTSVIIKLIDHLISQGKGVIVLLPEIALTPQSVRIFSSRYGSDISVLHSSLSAGERRDAWFRIDSGRCRIVIGTRSAVFAPVRDLGAVIIDEEQEHTYKSDQNPKYHARDIARFRCAHHRCLMLLSSATPSLESYYKAKEGAYSLLKLSSRYGNAELPQVEIVDIREETRQGNISPVSGRLLDALRENNQKKEQAILFLNRRGYNNFLSCPKCGEAVRCPSCSVAMTYHTYRGTYKSGRLVCHFCGRTQPLPDTCPQCGGAGLIRFGFGTQRVEQDLTNLLPEARAIRMDADATVAKFSTDEILSRFRNHEADILLGTQMVTKGHDFPRVTLVGVLCADTSLYLDDYRAYERTFSMLTQVIGRCGRADLPGKAYIQTANPGHEIIRLACAQDYDGFYEREIRLRKALVFPPFCDIALLTLSGIAEKEVAAESAALAARIAELTSPQGSFSDVRIQMFGPFEAPVYKVENKYRMRLVIKCKLNRQTRQLFAECLRANGADAGKPLLSVDFNPASL